MVVIDSISRASEAELDRVVASEGSGQPLPLRLSRAASAMLGADGAAITLCYTETTRLTVCATDEIAAKLEDLQDILREGPGPDAYSTGRMVRAALGERVDSLSASCQTSGEGTNSGAVCCRHGGGRVASRQGFAGGHGERDLMKRTPTQILAEVTSAMVRDHDVTGTLATLVRGCGEALSAGAVGLLVRSDSGQVELLSSSSHAMAELELFQVLLTTGPCIDAISGVSAISVTGPGDILARWPVVGLAIIEQAKGVLAFQQALDMSAAYDLLVRTAIRNRTSLTATAEGIVAKAQRRPRRV